MPGFIYVPPVGGGGGGAVDSVNGETGIVVLDAEDIDANLGKLASVNSDPNTFIYYDAAEDAVGVPITAYGREVAGLANAAALQQSIGVEPGVDVQAQSSMLDILSTLVGLADALIYFTAVDTVGTSSLTQQGRELLDDTSFSAMRTTLGLAIGTNVQAFHAILSALAGVASANGKLPYFTGASTMAVTDLTAFGRSLIEQVDLNAFTDLINLTPGEDVQVFNADLTAIAGLTSAANKLPYYTGAGTAALADLSAFGRTLIDDADNTAARTTLGLGALAVQATVTQKFEAVYSVAGPLVIGDGTIRKYWKRGGTITNVYISVGVAPTGSGSVLVDVNKNGTTIFTTQGNRPSISAGGFNDMTSIPDVTSMSAGDFLTIDVNDIGGTLPGEDLVVVVEWTETIS